MPPDVIYTLIDKSSSEDCNDIARALRRLIDSPQRRVEIASASFAVSREFSWTGCADQTLEFLSNIGHQNR